MGNPGETCKKCGAEARAGMKFCETCGASLVEQTESTGTSQIISQSADTPLPTPKPGDVAAVLRYREPTEPIMQSLKEMRLLANVAGAIAIVMIFIALSQGVIGSVQYVGWIISGVFIAWRIFVTLPSSIRKHRYHEARKSLIAPAIVNIIFLGFVPGIILLVAYFRSRAVEDAPPLHLDR
jgi:hypothetical protein